MASITGEQVQARTTKDGTIVVQPSSNRTTTLFLPSVTILTLKPASRFHAPSLLLPAIIFLMLAATSWPCCMP